MIRDKYLDISKEVKAALEANFNGDAPAINAEEATIKIATELKNNNVELNEEIIKEIYKSVKESNLGGDARYAQLLEDIQKQLLDRTGKHIEVMVYGDGAFKDPMGQIWELADPVVSPAYTKGLEGTPNELKLKYLADNDFAQLKGEELKKAIEAAIREKGNDLVGNMASQGTTPRRITDLIGSLCDLTSGSGDKGTPIVLVQGYFDNMTD